MKKRRLAIPCKTCDAGTLAPKKTYRLGPLVGVIGWIFLLPSLALMLLGVLGLFGAGAAAAAGDGAFRLSEQRTAALERSGASAELVERIESGGAVGQDQLADLSPLGARAVADAQLERSAHEAGTAVGAGIVGAGGILLIGWGLCSGLLGWLLTLKKRILQCDACGAAVAAS